MAEGRRRDEWQRTANLLAFVRFYGFRRVAWQPPRTFDPTAVAADAAKGEKPLRVKLSTLSGLFIKKPPCPPTSDPSPE